jgi:O-succinylbenzoic acid--CoA ligase
LIPEPIDIVLIDPRTPRLEIRRIVDHLKPDRIQLTDEPTLENWTGSTLPPDDLTLAPKLARFLMPTGGTTGNPRFAIHTWQTLHAAAVGFCQAFSGPAHGFCVLPLWHVGGLMQLVRALITEARLDLADWNAVEAGTARPDRKGVFLSLVPTQLHRLLEDPAATDWLRRFRAVFLGGAAAWPTLLRRARDARIPLAPAYGLTESAAQVCCLKPDEFLSGRSGVGRSLPHARISVVDDEELPVPAGRTGRIRIESEALFLGYQGELGRRGDGYVTTDLGSMDVDGYLTIAGRIDDAINSGGEMVMPTEVEAAIREAGMVEDVVVCGRSDPEWGEVVCALGFSSCCPGELEARNRLRPLLASHKIPRRWIQIDKVPRTALGKLDRTRAAGLIGLNDDQESNRRNPRRDRCSS